MGMPDLSDKENNPNLPQGSALNQLEAPKNRNNDNRNSTGASVRSIVEIKKEILQTADMETRRRLFELVRFRTSCQPMSSLREYVQRMVGGQADIYYMIGRSPQQLARSPFVRRVIEAGLEVIFMIDPILDEQVVKKLERHYDRFRLVSVNSEQLELPVLNNQLERKKRQREAIEEFLPLCKRLKSVYSEQIQKIVISNTLVESSCAMIPCEDVPIDDDVPSFNVNLESGRIRLEINPESDSLRLLCLQARVLEKKQEQFDDLVKFLFGPPTVEDSVVIEQPCSPFSDDNSDLELSN